MFDKVLVANRGEIALRVIRSCKELGVSTVAVHSTIDEESLHVRFADEAVCIGPPENSESYLNIPRIIAAAEVTGADAIHPGYGFLAENPHFAEVCEDCGFKFIGPSPEAIRRMGDKNRARQVMRAAGIPIIPGSKSIVASESQAVMIAEKIGFPILLKASSGGGGRGIRLVNEKSELGKALDVVRAEAMASFGSSQVYVEKFIKNPHHIEFQIIADEHGHRYHLWERDCSIQRRLQKVVEEAPSPALSESQRSIMGAIAEQAANAAEYSNVGTVEFLVGESGEFYFMEMNTRIQVEHPITEMITGINLVREQIRIAAGEKLDKQDIKRRKILGHSIECRINAEDPVKFTPNPGIISVFNLPGGLGVRVDTAAYVGYKISPYYDSMIAKLIVFGEDRREAILRMRRSLEELVIEGISTTVPFHQKVIDNEKFIAGTYDTNFIAEEFGC